ncbi:MAG: PIN domain-containing protein [Phycisphaerales bacterium]|nr:PIN domain-containing protein [Phycisphaerales bacterium]
MPASVFIETTIPSYYYETRKDRRTADWRAQTRLWWDKYAPTYTLVTSDFVIAEYLRAPTAKSARAARFFSGVTVLPVPARFEAVVNAYIEAKVMPADELGDAAHLAAASLHGIDFILTWNCRHLANANKARHIRAVNTRLGLPTPIIATPFEVIPE